MNYIQKYLIALSFLILALYGVYQLYGLVTLQRIKTLPAAQFRHEFVSIDSLKKPQYIYTAIAQRALNLVPPDLALARKANQKASYFSRPCLDCQMQLAYIDWLESGHLTQNGLMALQKSYQIAPYGTTEMMFWRLQISNQNWESLTPDLKRAALQQFTALAQSRQGRRSLHKLRSHIPEILERQNRLTQK